jgi:hypothetical protein
VHLILLLQASHPGRSFIEKVERILKVNRQLTITSRILWLVRPIIAKDVRIPLTSSTRYPIITNGQVAECNTIDIDENGPPSTIIVEVQDGVPGGVLKVDSP